MGWKIELVYYKNFIDRNNGIWGSCYKGVVWGSWYFNVYDVKEDGGLVVLVGYLFWWEIVMVMIGCMFWYFYLKIF